MSALATQEASAQLPLEDQITQLAAHIHAANYKLLELIREFDEQGLWNGPGMKSMAYWLNWKIGTAIGAAREKVRVAHALPDLPKISEAFREGRISYSKVRAMTRVATPENEEFLLSIARHGTASHVERLVRNYRKVKRIEALQDENRRHSIRELTLIPDEDGSCLIRGRLTPEQAAVIKKAMEVAMDESFQEREDVSAETSEGEPEPIAARRADALLRLAEGYLAGDRPGSAGDRNMVHVHVSAETLSDVDDIDAQIEDCGCVSAETAQRLTCDASILVWREDEDGELLDVGRKTRTIPPAIRRALQRRDSGCAFPGCNCQYTDAHHIVHWSKGGETKLDNLTLLCEHHHRLVHEAGFGVEMDDHGRPKFFQPDGTYIPTSDAGRFRGNVVDLFAENHGKGLEITPKTTRSLWHGEKMDDQIAVGILLQFERRGDGDGLLD